jgi:hypothetical protein
VIDGEDSKGGRLGTLTSAGKRGGSIKPKIIFELYAEIVDQQELTTASEAKGKSLQLKNKQARQEVGHNISAARKANGAHLFATI